MNLAGLELAPAGDRPSTLSTQRDILIKLRPNFKTLFTLKIFLYIPYKKNKIILILVIKLLILKIFCPRKYR